MYMYMYMYQMHAFSLHHIFREISTFNLVLCVALCLIHTASVRVHAPVPGHAASVAMAVCLTALTHLLCEVAS